MRLTATISLCIGVVTSALAPAPASAQAQPELATLAIRSEVDRLIAAAGAEALFENISTQSMGVARHRASGMVCLFTPGHRLNLIVVYPTVPGGPAAGDDVSCRSGSDLVFFTVYATRYLVQPSEQERLDHAMADAHGVWTDIAPMDGDVSYQASRNYPEPLIAAFTGRLEGHHLRSLTLVQNVGEWSFKGRASGPVNDESVFMAGSGYYSAALPGNWEERLRQP